MAAGLAVDGATVGVGRAVQTSTTGSALGHPNVCATVKEAEAILQRSIAQNSTVAEVRSSAVDAIAQAKTAIKGLENSTTYIDETIARTSSFDDQWEAFKRKFDDLTRLAADRLKDMVGPSGGPTGLRPAEFVSVERVAQVLRRSSRVVVLTGAGVSAESGIPTFRGADGYWTIGSENYTPQEMATWEMFNKKPEELWRWYQYRWGVCRSASPNAGHYALVELESLVDGGIDLVTQNIDGLHLDAGSRRDRLYEIHGRIDEMRCDENLEGACLHGVDLNDPEQFPKVHSTIVKIPPPAKEERDERLPHCAKCGCRQRPKILWFDECYNEAIFRRKTVMDATQACDVLLIIGTQLTTGMPSSMVRTAREANSIIINIDPNADLKDERFAGMLHLKAKSGEILPQILAELRKLREEPLLAPLASASGLHPPAKAIAHAVPSAMPKAHHKAAAKVRPMNGSRPNSGSALAQPKSPASSSSSLRSSSVPAGGRRSMNSTGASSFKAAASLSLSKGKASRAKSPPADRSAPAVKSKFPSASPAPAALRGAACGFFVYGTLRPDDDSGAAWTKDFQAGFDAEAAILPGASLYHEGYPAVNFEQTRCSVRGVLLRPQGPDPLSVMSSKLVEADRIEGYPDLYDRAIVTVHTAHGEALPAYVYHRTGRTDRSSCVRIPDGDWLSRRRERA